MSRLKYYTSYVKETFIVGSEGVITERPALGLSLETGFNRTLAKTKNAILIVHVSSVTIKHQGGL